MSKKMTDNVKTLVEIANKIFQTDYMQKNEDDRKILSSYVSHKLLSKEMYHGFNYYIKKDEMLCLAGKETNIIQFYIK